MPSPRSSRSQARASASCTESSAVATLPHTSATVATTFAYSPSTNSRIRSSSTCPPRVGARRRVADGTPAGVATIVYSSATVPRRTTASEGFSRRGSGRRSTWLTSRTVADELAIARGMVGAAQVGDGPTPEQLRVVQGLLDGYFGVEADAGALE